MIRYSEALNILLRAADSRGLLSIETVPLSDACGRIAASEVLSAEALPGFDNSSMDGYAVMASETQWASPASPIRLPVLGSVAAGEAPSPSRGRKSGAKTGAYEIMTGAPIPPGCNAVIKVEEVKLDKDGRSNNGFIEITAPAEVGDYVRYSGQDFKPGMPIVDAGTLLDERHAPAFAALGVTRLRVRRKPRVAIISTGKELVEPEQKPGPGQIRNATAAYLMEALPKLGAKTEFYGAVRDDSSEFIRKMRRVLKESPDIVVTTGAVSAGRHDFVTASAREMGAENLFHHVAIRPGKPGLAARFREGPLFFGMPGNPVSTIVALRFFVAPVLRRLLGQPTERPIRMKLEADVSKPAGLRCFLKAKAEISSAGAEVRVLPGQASFQIQPLLDADAWAALPEAGDHVLAGTELDVFPMMPDRWRLQGKTGDIREKIIRVKLHQERC